MKRIKSFGDWNLLNEAKLYYLSNFKKALDSSPVEFSEIVSDLRKLWGKETGVDITLIDIEENMLSYSTGKGMEDLLDKNLNSIEITNNENDILSLTRSKIKIGRFLNKVINTPKKYPESLIDKFVVYLQSNSKNTDDKWKISLVKGDEIAKYYNSNNYRTENKFGSSLWQSCMSDKLGRDDVTVRTPHGTSTTFGVKGVSNIFDIYTKNPEVCNLLIMTDESGKLAARALVWNVSVKQKEKDLGNIKFIDRIYSTEDWMVMKIQNWAKENGMARRLTNIGYNCSDIFYGEEKYYNVQMDVSVKKIHYSAFPYLDTFNYYDVKGGKLLNYKSNNFKGFGLQSTSGDWGTTTGYSPRIINYIRKFNK
jgi:hypothetical protein